MEAKKSILFVDDEPKLLDGLRRSLFPYGDLWEVEFASSGAEALRMLTVSSFDVVVTDMRMPGMNGAELLNEVARLYPQIVRMILSGTWQQDLRVQAAMIAHQYLSKPCDPEVLKATLERAFALRAVLVRARLAGLDRTHGVASQRTRRLPGTPPGTASSGCLHATDRSDAGPGYGDDREGSTTGKLGFLWAAPAHPESRRCSDVSGR